MVLIHLGRPVLHIHQVQTQHIQLSNMSVLSPNIEKFHKMMLYSFMELSIAILASRG